MSKYDFQVDLSNNSSTGIILNKIPKGAYVLEFGCATGRMTRYMKESLGCRVCVVEYDTKAYEKAIEYAEDGLCDDIMSFRWEEKFGGCAFDVIVFADVLEHLSNPEEVLRRAAGLLKEEGLICVSLPNITHNDVLLKACSERFDYMPTGILDDTHIHFWGMKNLAALAEKAGIYIERAEATYCPTGESEQASGEKNHLLENILNERVCGNVYQFVLTLRKKACSAEYDFRVPAVRSSIYLDRGEDFLAEDVIVAEAAYSGNGSYALHVVISDTNNLRAIRLDPTENQSCLLKNLRISQNDTDPELFFSEGVQTKAGLLLTGSDPAVLAYVCPNASSVTVEAEIILPGRRFINELESICADELEDCAEKEKLWCRERESLKEEICRLEKENENLRKNLSASIVLANRKEEYILQLEKRLPAPSECLGGFVFLLRRGKKAFNLAFAFAKRAVRGVFRRVKQIAGRGEAK